MRTVIFGIDGLTFRILHPLIERGELPNFKKLQDQGCEAILESKSPPLTPPAWTSLSTGVKPARHGIYDYWVYNDKRRYDNAPRVQTSVQTRRRAEKAIWNILSDYGKQVLVVNVPATYPPEPVNGTLVSGYLTPGTDVEFTAPASFKKELLTVAPQYQFVPDDQYERQRIHSVVRRKVDVLLLEAEQRTRLLLHMLKEQPWDFCFVVYMGGDRLQHQLWEEVTALDPRTNAYYHLLDDALGQVLALLGPEDCLFVVSDHGFRGHHSCFDINEYLISKGLLVLSDDARSERLKASRVSRLRQDIAHAGLRPLARTAKRYLKATGMWRSAGIDATQPLLTGIDWEKTLAYAPSFSGFQGGYADVFFHPDIEHDLIAEVSEDLKRLRTPDNSKPLIEAIYNTDIFGSGPYAPSEPHLLLLPQEGITFRMDLGNAFLWEDFGKTFGSHHPHGVLYAYGAPFKQGFRAPGAEIFDLVPTVLNTMGLPFPCDFDGRVLHELFVQKSASEQELVMTGKSAQGSVVSTKLKNLLSGEE